jgi:hypothetical protein
VAQREEGERAPWCKPAWRYQRRRRRGVGLSIAMSFWWCAAERNSFPSPRSPFAALRLSRRLSPSSCPSIVVQPDPADILQRSVLGLGNGEPDE